VRRLQRWLNSGLLAFTLLALTAGGILRVLDRGHLADLAWGASGVLLAALLLVEVVRHLLRREMGVDLIALLAISGAVAMGQALVAAVIALMLSGGRALEDYVGRRAERELRRLIDRAPRFAWRYRDDELEKVPVDEVVPGDRLLLRMGEVVPVDGTVLGASATLDESALTGESLPVRRAPGELIRSGGVNAGSPFEFRAGQSARQSTYAGIVRMVESARDSRAPMARLADRYALILIPVTLLIAGLAWLFSGDPLRALAVLVVATPCPLILAVPVALVAGISRCAKRGILVKNGGTLEALAGARTLFLDKTGTLTTGQAVIVAVETAGTMSAQRLLQLSASLAQASPHVIAQAIVTAAHQRELPLQPPVDVHEQPGAGLLGHVDGHAVVLGNAAYVAAQARETPWIKTTLQRMDHESMGGSFIAIDGTVAGAVLFSDQLRLESPRALRLLRRAGIQRIVMLTGDRIDTADTIGLAAGVDEVHAGLEPADKLDAIVQARALGITLMVGDGINDAPALAAADVGIAMGARGATASSEAADVVLLADRLDRIAEAMQIARRSRRIAVQGVLGGMGLSFVAMLVAAWGYLPPLDGAIVQEVIDVAVIVHALRALGAARGLGAVPALEGTHADRLRLEHNALLPLLQRLHDSARTIAGVGPHAAQRELTELLAMLDRDLLPHEHADEADLYPQLASQLHGEDPLAAMSHTHREIFRLVQRLKRLHAAADETTSGMEQVQHLLLQLDTVVRLHLEQEEELYYNLDRR
jgi:heavy metal translocating P-type ATPase